MPVEPGGRPAIPTEPMHGAPAIRVAGLAVLSLCPGAAAAHAFGARYDLPLPLWLYLGAAGAAVVLSFAVTALLVRDPPAPESPNAAPPSEDPDPEHPREDPDPGHPRERPVSDPEPGHPQQRPISGRPSLGHPTTAAPRPPGARPGISRTSGQPLVSRPPVSVCRGHSTRGHAGFANTRDGPAPAEAAEQMRAPHAGQSAESRISTIEAASPELGWRGWWPLRVLAVSMLIVVLVASIVGPESPTGNFASVFVWIVWWVGLALMQAVVANVWEVSNPWETMFWPLERWPRIRKVPYPRWLSSWPAVVMFVAFAWLELISSAGDHPRTIALLAMLYTVISGIGALTFGASVWFRLADPFSVVFSTLARLAPVVLSRRGVRRTRLRWPGYGLLVAAPVATSMVVLVIALLATVFFDGFKETSAWAAVLDGITASEALRAPLLALRSAGVNLLELVETLGLLAVLLVFGLVYLLFSWQIDRASRQRLGLSATAGLFVQTLVPIAVGYHFAHYLSYLLIAGQLAIPLASDPFGLGWDLFSTADYSIDIAIVDARFVWYSAVASIVVGHVIAVYLAHLTALRLYRDRSAAVRSQIPMLVLMVGYTMSSLWILSQPIVEL